MSGPHENERSDPMTTAEWTELHGMSVLPTDFSVEAHQNEYPRSARDIAVRVLVLHGVGAVGAGVDATPVIDWFSDEGIWDHVTPKEAHFLQSLEASDEERARFFWHKEAEWTLLWVLEKVEDLGLPTTQCDSSRLNDYIIPPLGGSIEPFLESALIRSPCDLLVEDMRSYDMWCRALKASRNGTLPEDLLMPVLYERRYAFEWLTGFEAWDDVQCDA